MIRLLSQTSRDGFPDDYLFARLRAKRQRLTGGRVGDDRAGREWLQSDYRAVYVTMRPALRQRFAPYFLFFEVRTLQLLLRAMAGNDHQQLRRLCAGSLLHQKFLQQVEQCEQLPELLGILQAWFGELLQRETFDELYERGGNRRLEEALADGILTCLSARRLSPELAAFLADQVDLRNLLSAGRVVRWELEELPLLAGGGAISRQLIAARDRAGRPGLKQVISQFGGADTDLALVEASLLARFSRRIGRAGRDPLGDSLVLDYLWRGYLALRTDGLKRWAGDAVAAWEGVA